MNLLKNKIVRNEGLDDIIESIREKELKIVFTNGCFDILHKGHVEYLAQAADFGDFLIIGINSDSSVHRQNKGSDRPINNLDARSTLLAALQFVDLVVEFNEDTPMDLIRRISPDVLIKGGDYDPAETNAESPKYIVGRDIVLKNGGKVEVIQLVEGYSTTNTIEKLKK